MVSLAKYFEEAQVANYPEWFHEIKVVNPDDPDDEDFAIRWHQVTGLNLTFLASRSALYDEQGTGKSLISGAWAIWNAAMGNKCVCLMPPVLTGQYAHNLKNTFLGIEKYLKIGVYKGTLPKRQKLLDGWGNKKPDIVIMGYQIFLKEAVMFDEFTSIVLDEAKLANESSKTNIQIDNFMGDYEDKNALVLNGTPASNDLRDLYGFIEFVSPGTYRSRLQFNMKHVVFKSIPIKVESRGEICTRDIEIVDSFVNTDEMYANLYKNARRVEKSQVLELKEKNIIPVTVELSDSHLAKYKKFVGELLLEFDDGSILKGTTSASLRANCMQAVMHPDILQVNEVSEVVAVAAELVDNILRTGRKALIFCHFQKTVELLAEYFKKLNPAVIYGPSDTEKNKDKFLKDDTCRIAVANYQSGGVGLNLQSVCSDIVCAEPTTVPAQFDQATDRVHRSGQKEIVNVYVLIAQGTAFVKCAKDLTRKKLVIARVVSKATIMDELLGEDTASTRYTKSQEPSGLDDLTGGWKQI